ncbi:HEAT repeat domain-containing protein [Amycolatopsis taiwanensis]|uniref:HEAT repeat domain-containing protein n=1 Tax=Amycolatopsis taiwanensis TaxID=342230 RepID=UPI00146FA478
MRFTVALQRQRDVLGWPVRQQAATGLGDAGEVAGLEPLTKALKDSHPTVRRLGVEAVRRLGNAGLRNAVLSHPIRDVLVELLHDPLRDTRIASARTLGSLGEVEVLREFTPRSSRDRREWERILQGAIPR